MRKTNFLRVASVLLVLTLLSTCAISGTFAKYVTATSTQAVANVAKWGVVIYADYGNFDEENWDFIPAFLDSYESDTAGYATNTVVSSTEDAVVAPGTKGNVLWFAVDGEPEVAWRLVIAITGSNTSESFTQPVLPAGVWRDCTSYEYDDSNAVWDWPEYTTTEDYYPVVFTLVEQSDPDAIVAEGTLDDILDGIYYYLRDWYGDAVKFDDADGTVTTYPYAVYVDIPANQGFDPGEFDLTLSWEWEFDDETHSHDIEDTYLGNLADHWVIDSTGTASTTLDFAFTVSATQID